MSVDLCQHLQLVCISTVKMIRVTFSWTSKVGFVYKQGGIPNHHLKHHFLMCLHSRRNGDILARTQLHWRKHTDTHHRYTHTLVPSVVQKVSLYKWLTGLRPCFLASEKSREKSKAPPEAPDTFACWAPARFLKGSCEQWNLLTNIPPTDYLPSLYNNG